MAGRPLVVQKFGGTSVGDLDRIRHVAGIIADTYRAGQNVVAVVSAMAGETDRLTQLAHAASPAPEPRELDCLLATGEQVSVALLSMVLCEMGLRAQSLLGFQMGMRTEPIHNKARILGLSSEPFERALAEDTIVVAAGFQGVDSAGAVTTLGRGGTDTTAVAIAAHLKAARCDIFTDVDGVYTADPRIVPGARRLDRVAFEEMLELASSGAKVLQIRSVEMAMKYGVPVRVLSSFAPGPGTLVTEEDASMENVVVAGVSSDRNEAKIAVRGVPDVPGIAASILTPLSDAHIVVDMIIQNTAQDGTTDFSFTVPSADLPNALEITRSVASEQKFAGVESDSEVAKVSVVGIGMRNHAGVATKMFQILSSEGINIQMISTSEIKISVVIPEKYLELAVRALHKGFGLEADG